MTPYANLGGNSGVSSYEAGDDFIRVKFKDGSAYLYNDNRPGPHQVEEMGRLAARGQGLNSYISQCVRKNYARKER